MPAAHLERLYCAYPGSDPVLKAVDLRVEPGETIAILGPSGGGKSTLLKAMAGLVPPEGGMMEVLGQEWPKRPAAGSVGYIPQRLGLVRHATVLQNVLQGALHETPLWRSLLAQPEPQVHGRARDATRALGIDEKANTPVRDLSGGQQRRVAIARALVQRPRLLLADEFLGELDPDTVDAVIRAVRRLQEECGTTTILVEHHLDQAMRLAHRVFNLKDGRLREVSA